MYQTPYPNQLSRAAFDGVAPFADPYVDIASQVMPTSVPAMLRHAEFLAVAGDGVLREAYNRVAAYFVTKVNIEGELGEDERTKQEEYLNDQLYINSFLVEHGLSGLVYGHRYLSVFKPFTRYLSCPRCSASYKFSEFAENEKVHHFRWDGAFHGRCPACGREGDFGIPKDVEDESRPLNLRSWNPHDMRMVWNQGTEQAEAFDWVIPADFRSDVRRGTDNPYILASTPWPWLKAAATDKNVRFSPDTVKYWREPALAGLRFRGVGVPRAIVNLRRLYYTQILLRMNEVLAVGHVAPMRVVSPANTAGRSGEETDILRIASQGDLRSNFMAMTMRHRMDPNSIHYSPVPLQMQALGADARQLIPADLLSQAVEMELNAVGVPVDLFKMTMQINVAPVGLRLFARYWSPFVDGLNGDLAFMSRKIQFLKRWETARYKLGEVPVVDDIDRRNLEMQMAQAGLLARSTALEQVDKKFRVETRKKIEDLRIEAEEQDKAQQQDDAFAFSRQLSQAGPAPAGGQPGAPAQGAPPGGADPSAAQGAPAAGQGGPAGQPGVGTDPLAGLVPQPGQKVDPQTMYSSAQTAAQTLMQMSDGDRFTKLREIDKVNPPFHKLVKGIMEDMRSADRSKGQKIVAQQRQQGGGQ